jgi:isopenicillin-N epimerase
MTYDAPARFANDPASLRAQFLLDPSVTFLNHGSFGACPAPVFDAYQNWQRELERQPVQFMKYRAARLMADARDVLAQYLHVPSADLVFAFNATAAVHMSAGAIAGLLRPGDEILTTDHEYHPCSLIWADVAARAGAQVVTAQLPLPYRDDGDCLDALWEHVTPRTRVIFMSHLSSVAALHLPVEAVCARARAQGIITVIDGAHAPGQIALDLSALGADFYGGNCHKWMCAPKGAGFLYVSPAYQALMRPLFLSWGWYEGADFTTRQHEQGTRDPAALLAVPDAIAFMRDHDWNAVRARCRDLLLATRAAIHTMTGLPCIVPDSHISQMCSIPLRLPDGMTASSMKEALYDDWRIEVPVNEGASGVYLRISIQGYNDQADADRLIAALRALL